MSVSLRDVVRRCPRGLLGMVILVVLCESYIARNHLKFSRVEADDWSDSARVASGELPAGGVLFFGDSQIKFGVSPLLLEGKLGQPSHCLAVQGGQAPSSYLFLRRALDAGVVPSAIVVDFEPHLNNEGFERNRRMWAEVADWGECLELAWHVGASDAFATMALGKVLLSYRERVEIRGSITSALRGEDPFMTPWLKMTHRNKGMNRGALAIPKKTDGSPVQVAQWGNPRPKPWAPDPVNDIYARKFMQLAMDHKIPVYCLIMPVAPALLEKYQKNGLETHYDAWIRQLQSQFSNLFVLDYRHSGYPETCFGDGIHLNLEGAGSITVALGDYLQRTYQGIGIDVRWVPMPPFRTDGVNIQVEDSARSNAFIQSMETRRR